VDRPSLPAATAPRLASSPLRQTRPAPPLAQIPNGSHIKQAAIWKAKQVANASNGNAKKKRRKELKPIITNEGQPVKL